LAASAQIILFLEILIFSKNNNNNFWKKFFCERKINNLFKYSGFLFLFLFFEIEFWNWIIYSANTCWSCYKLQLLKFFLVHKERRKNSIIIKFNKWRTFYTFNVTCCICLWRFFDDQPTNPPTHRPP
jgi:hypothetical protein